MVAWIGIWDYNIDYNI